MRVILNSIYGYAMLQYLTYRDIIIFYRVNTELRTFITSSDVTNNLTFQKFVPNMIDSCLTEELLLACISL